MLFSTRTNVTSLLQMSASTTKMRKQLDYIFRRVVPQRKDNAIVPKKNCDQGILLARSTSPVGSQVHPVFHPPKSAPSNEGPV